MNSNELPFSNYTGAYPLRPLGALEEFIWLLDQSRPAHFVMAAEVSGSTTLSDWWRALDFVQARHPLLSVRISQESGRQALLLSGTHCFNSFSSSPRNQRDAALGIGSRVRIVDSV